MAASELERLYPREYARADGGVIGPAWAGRDVPVPPEWVKSRVSLPRGLEPASLAKEISELYPEDTREVLVRYVKSWRDVQRYGTHLVIAGTDVTFKRRQWAASAVINEIVRNYGASEDITGLWLNAEFARHLIGDRESRYDSFMSTRSRLFKAKICYIENPLRTTPGTKEHYLIEDLYQFRADRNLPTITTMGANLTDGFSVVRPLLGRYITEIIELNSTGYVAHL